MKFLLFILSSFGIRLWFCVDQTGGPIIELKFGGRAFPVTADSDPEVALGGYKVTLTPNGMMGSAKPSYERINGGVKGVTLVLDSDRDDFEFIVAKNNLTALQDLQVTYANGDVYYGKTKITSDLNSKPKTSTIDLDFECPSLKKQ